MVIQVSLKSVTLPMNQFLPCLSFTSDLTFHSQSRVPCKDVVCFVRVFKIACTKIKLIFTFCFTAVNIYPILRSRDRADTLSLGNHWYAMNRQNNQNSTLTKTLSPPISKPSGDQAPPPQNKCMSLVPPSVQDFKQALLKC